MNQVKTRGRRACYPGRRPIGPFPRAGTGRCTSGGHSHPSLDGASDRGRVHGSGRPGPRKAPGRPRCSRTARSPGPHTCPVRGPFSCVRPRTTPRSPTISEPRINDRIRVSEVRLVGPAGEQVGIVRVEDALRLAQEADLDLVEVAPDARPPVAKLMDYGKFKYEADMKAREARRNQANTVLKEIRFRLKIDPHDYGTKKGHVERFLSAGDKVKVMIMFRGREQSRPEAGCRLLQRLAEDVAELGFIESSPKQDGRNMIMVLGPTRKKADARRAAQQSEAKRGQQSAPKDESPSTAAAAASEAAPESAPAAATPAAEPAKAARAAAATAKVAPAEAVPAEPAPPVAAPEEAVPAKATPAKATPAKATPAKATPAKATAAKAAPAKATPAEATPAKAAPAKAAPAKEAAPAKPTPAKPAPKPAPGKKAAAKPAPSKDSSNTES